MVCLTQKGDAKAAKKAYVLKIVYETLNMEDNCPLAYIRVISKPINDTI